MAFNWNGRFVLRRKNETAGTHRVYKHAASSSQITDADNFFSTAPDEVPKSAYRASSVKPQRCWQVTLDGQPGTVTMCVYQLSK